MPLTRSRSFAILISRAVFGSSFSRAASDPLASSSSFVPPGVACPIVVICPRIVSSSPSLVPLVRLVRAGSGTGRYHPLVVIISLLASKQAGWRVHVVHIVHVVHVVRVLVSWLALRYGFPSSFVPVASKRGKRGGAVSSSLRLARPSRGGRLVQSERTGVASSSMPWDKQADNGGGAMSSSLRLVRPSRGVRLVSSTLVRLVRRDVGRGVARCRSCGNVGKQAGGGGLGFASSSRLCLFGEHQFDIRIPWGVFVIPVPLPCSR